MKRCGAGVRTPLAEYQGHVDRVEFPTEVSYAAKHTKNTISYHSTAEAAWEEWLTRLALHRARKATRNAFGASNHGAAPQGSTGKRPGRSSGSSSSTNKKARHQQDEVPGQQRQQQLPSVQLLNADVPGKILLPAKMGAGDDTTAAAASSQ